MLGGYVIAFSGQYIHLLFGNTQFCRCSMVLTVSSYFVPIMGMKRTRIGVTTVRKLGLTGSMVSHYYVAYGPVIYNRHQIPLPRSNTHYKYLEMLTARLG